MKIIVIGAGYVGLSVAIVLSKNNDVTIVDISEEKINLINKWESPLKDDLIIQYLNKHLEYGLRLNAIKETNVDYKDADYVIVATPTNYNYDNNYFDTSIVESVIAQILNESSKTKIIIKSTVPIGFTDGMNTKYSTNRIMFSPEFLRETKALYDNLFPSRIIVGCSDDNKKTAEEFANLLLEGCEKKDVEVLLMGNKEAESVKLFANTYLALRVSFFNELDTYAEMHSLDTNSIVKGISLDSRIGNYYNNPSFGYGGYCLPKDTKQLLANYLGIPQNLIAAIVESNKTRKEYIANRIKNILINKKINKEYTVGVYRLAMKNNSDNFRESSVLDIIQLLNESGIVVIVYEPILGKDNDKFDFDIINDLKIFKEKSDLIIANRYDNLLDDVKEKVYTRDLFRRD